MLRIVSLSFLIFASLSPICRSEGLTVGDLINGVNQASLTIQSGEVTSVTTLKRAVQKSEKEIAASIQAKKEEELRNFTPDPFFPDVDVKKFEKDYLIPTLNYYANQDRQRTEIDHSTTLFEHQLPAGTGTNDPGLYQYKMTTIDAPGLSLDSEAAQHRHAGIFFLLAYDAQKQVKQTIGDIVFPYPPSHAVQFFGSDTHGGYWNFSQFGRSGSSVPADAKLIGKENIEGAACYILKMTTSNGWTKQVWVDVDKDFCVRKMELRRTPDKLEHITVFKKFEKFGDVWFPKIRESTFYQKDGTVRAVLRTEITGAQFNVNFSKDFFKIDKDFYFQQFRHPGMGLLPDSGISPTSPATGPDNLLLLCGPQSLSRICELLKVDTNLSELKKLSGFAPDRGTTMLGLKKAATYKGLAPSGVRVPLVLLQRKKLPMPAIAYVGSNHFIVFEAIDKEGVKISDPARKYEPHLTWDDLSEIWSGELLIFDKKKARRAKQKHAPLAFSNTPEYNFGKVLGGSKIEHTFTVKNIGKKPLKILSVKETCVCTAFVLSQDEIPPGKTGSISTVLTVPSGNKRVQENLLVLTNNPVQSMLTLTLKGEAFTPLKTFPERLVCGNQPPLQKPLTKRVSLHVQEGVQILGVRTDSKHLKATLKTTDSIPHVEVQLLPTLPVGQFSHNLLVDYAYKGKRTTHNVLAFGEVIGALHVAPNRLFLGLIKEPSTISKTITISARGSNPFQITSVEASSKAIVVTVKADETKTHYNLTATISPKAKPGELAGDIVINTSSSVQPTIRVPFFGIIVDAK